MLPTRSHLCVRWYCCSQVCGSLKAHRQTYWNTPMAKQSSQALERLKITLDWQPNCRHYSFHHFYQPCGAHAVGGQSSCFHGAFHASPSTQPSRYPLIFSLFFKILSSASPLWYIHLTSLFPSFSSSIFPLSSSACFVGSADEWHPIQRGDEDEGEGKSLRKTFIFWLHGIES